MRRLLSTVLLAAVVVVTAAAASGGTTINSARIGSLPFGDTSPAELQASVGKAQRVWRSPGKSTIEPSGLFLNGVTAYGYGCATNGCATVYAFRQGRMIGFWTRSPQFHTAAGTRVGTALATALRQERGERWSGLSVQCPSIDLSGTGPEFKADIAARPARVAGFLVTYSPHFFSDGC